MAMLTIFRLIDGRKSQCMGLGSWRAGGRHNASIAAVSPINRGGCLADW
jgi:hypothetical protein